MPKGVYCSLVDRQQKLVDEFAERYPIPCDGASIDLYAVLTAFHDLVIEHSHVFADDDDSNALKKEKLREEILERRLRNRKLEVQIEVEEGKIIYREQLRETLHWFAAKLRSLGKQLGRTKTGADAQRRLNEYLAQLAIEIDSGRLNV